jgi:SAM-dependent methyltransferase
LHASIFAEFQRLCASRKSGGDVLEVGAVPAEDTLLCLPALAGAKTKIGINLDGPHRYRDFDILRADANRMSCFSDESFDTVLCNSVLEHDKHFWMSVAEIHRVTRPGGLIVIGVPGFAGIPRGRKTSRLMRILYRLQLPGAMVASLEASTLTLQPHFFPGDYYRFTEQVVKEVFLDGSLNIEVRTLMLPPRIIGAGIKPA